MKILITNHFLDERAGSELFTKGLSFELKKRGHEVFVFSPIVGKVAEEIKENEIKVSDNILDFKDEIFDVIHAQHNTTAIITRSVFPEVPMVFMSHGILPELEQPPSIDLGILKYVAVSEEVKGNLVNNYLIKENKIDIVRNFVDFSKFHSKKPINDKLKKILVLSNHYSDEVKNVIEFACAKLDVKVLHVGMPDNPVEDVEAWINKVDLVVTLGRGVLEAIACERNVIVYDIHGGDGFIDENNFFEIRKHNFSGRNKRIKYSGDQFKNELLKYDSSLGKKLKKIILEENSIEKSVDELEKIYNSILKKSFVSKIDRGELFKEISFLEKILFAMYKDNKFINESLGKKDIQINDLNIKVDEIHRKQKEIDNFKKNIEQKQNEIDNLNAKINLIKSSKFWTLREMYLKFKKMFKL